MTPTELKVSWTADPAGHDLGAAITELVLQAELGRRLPDAELIRSDAVGYASHVSIGPEEDLRLEEIAALVPRHVPGPVLAQRVAHLRATAVLPDETDTALITYDDRAERPHELGSPGAATLVELPAAPVQDAVAVLSVAAALVTADAFLAAVAAAFGARSVEPGGDLEAALDRTAATPLPAEVESIDRRLDEIAVRILEDFAAATGVSRLELAERRASRFATELDDVRRTHHIALSGAALARRRSDEALQDAFHELDAAKDELFKSNSAAQELRAQRALLRSENEHLRAELEAVYATKTFRATAALRRAYSRVRFGREP